MSALTSVSGSSDVAYATQLAQTSALKRSLSCLGAALEGGDLTSAASILAAIMKSNPQFATTGAAGSAADSPINKDFQALGDAVSKNQVDAAKSAWTQTKSDLAAGGITNLGNGAADTAKLLAQNRADEDQALLGAIFGSSSANSVSSLLPGVNTASGTDISSVVGDWLTYEANGSASPPVIPGASGGEVNTTA